MEFLKAQLAQPITVEEIDHYLRDDEWWFEQKLDGVRLLIQTKNGKAIGINRKGSEVGLESAFTNGLSELPEGWIFDGEHIEGTFWVFDMISPLIPSSAPYWKRREAAETIVHMLNIPKMKVLPAARSLQEKIELTQWCINNNSEGIMLKHKNAPYAAGLRSTLMLKLKFWATADVIVTEVGREDKRSVSVSVWDQGLLVDVGSIGVTEDMLNKIKEGDIIEVKYLYFTPSTRLYQPSFLRIRTDKDSEECVMAQMKTTSKQVKQ